MRVTSCTFLSSSPERVSSAKGGADKKGSHGNRWRRGQTLKGAGGQEPAPEAEELGSDAKTEPILFESTSAARPAGRGGASHSFAAVANDWEYERRDVPTEDAPDVKALLIGAGGADARIALAAGFTMLFFAGASFTAGAGDKLVRLADDDAAAVLAAGHRGGTG